MRICSVLLVALVTSLTTSAVFGQAFASGLLNRLGGDTEKVELQRVSENESMRFRGKAIFELSAKSIWRFGSDRAVLRGPYVLLRDGSRLAAPSLTSDREAITFPADEIHPGLWDGLKLPLTNVQAILWKTPLGKKGLSACLELMTPVNSDTLRLDNGDQVQGEFRGIVLHEATQAEEVVFVVRGVESRIALTRAVSLQLKKRADWQDGDSKDQWAIAFTDGSRVNARKLVLNEPKATWLHGNGQSQEVAAEMFAKNCILVQPPRRDVVFLSDLTAQGYRHFPLFGDAATWKADRCATGEPLWHRGGYFDKGIGMWSNSRLSFAVPKDAVRFEAEIGIDDRANDEGSAVFRVLTQFQNDKGVDLKDLYKSDVLRGGMPSREVSVNIQGASTLILLVEAADGGETLDLADWIDARFVTSSAAP